MTFDLSRMAASIIHAVNDKLGEKNVKELLNIYSIAILTEIKTSRKISCSVFEVYQNSSKQGHWWNCITYETWFEQIHKEAGQDI